MEKEAKDFSKKEWEALIRFGVKLKDRDAPFMTILKGYSVSLSLFTITSSIEHLQELVEDDKNHISKPPESISEPIVLSLEETMLEQERQRQMRDALSLVDRVRIMSWLKPYFAGRRGEQCSATS